MAAQAGQATGPSAGPPAARAGPGPRTTSSSSASASASASASGGGSHRSSFSGSLSDYSDEPTAGPSNHIGGRQRPAPHPTVAASNMMPISTMQPHSVPTPVPQTSPHHHQQHQQQDQQSLPSQRLMAPPLASTSSSGSGAPGGGPHHRRPQTISKHQQHLYQNHTAELAAYISSVFLPSVLPTAEEYQAKEQTRQYLETLAVKVSPGARLLPFGSIASGLALRNSDMDLCCLIDQGENKEERSASELVETLGSLIQQETAFMVKMLPKARIPIIKLSLAPSLGQPFGLACDIGFENRLALENTRLLLTYAMVDPRMRSMVLFIKVWTKRRKINDPYLGTLSSYGYVLLVIYYLTNVRRMPVLPNLQALPMPRPMSPEELEYQGHQIYFFDDLEALPQFWTASNRENVAELLIDFFRYFANSFRYGFDVVSVRTPGGLLSKEEKGWLHDFIEDGSGGKGYARVDLNRLCIEDPFQTNYNVARTVTRDGLFTIRGEFMRAVRILLLRTDRIDMMIRELCEERQGGVLMAPPQNASRRKPAPHHLQHSAHAPSHARDGPPNSSGPRQGQFPFHDFRAWQAAMGSMPLAPNTAPLPYQTQGSRGSPPRRQSSLEPSTSPIPEDDFPHRYPQPPSPDPGYPQLTTDVMQDHAFRQGAAATDARPRFPPESVASEPPPLEHDRDWNRDAGNFIPPSSSASSSGMPVTGFNGRLVYGRPAVVTTELGPRQQPATAPASPGSGSPTSASPPRTRTHDSGPRSSSHSVTLGRRRTQPNLIGLPGTSSSLFINGRAAAMPDFSKFPTGPIRFGDFGGDGGLGMADAFAAKRSQPPLPHDQTAPPSTASAPSALPSKGMNGVLPTSVAHEGLGSPTTPKAVSTGPAAATVAAGARPTSSSSSTVNAGQLSDVGVLPRTPGSPAQLSRKIVFGDVEVPPEALREAREKALAALLRKRRPPTLVGIGIGSSNGGGKESSGGGGSGGGSDGPKTPPRHRRVPSAQEFTRAVATAASGAGGISFGTAVNGIGGGGKGSEAGSE